MCSYSNKKTNKPWTAEEIEGKLRAEVENKEKPIKKKRKEISKP